MLLLGLDLETTGLDTAQDRIIEIGLVVYDSSADKMLDMVNLLVQQDLASPEAVKVAAEVAGLSQADLSRRGLPPAEVLSVTADYMAGTAAVVAHNGTLFDKVLLAVEFKRHGIAMPDKVWIDTCLDLPYPPKVSTRKLTYLAVEHGFMNPFPHRAIFDVITMLQVLRQYDVDLALDSAQQPTLAVQALTNYDQRDLAKAAGFYWRAERKAWIKAVKANKLEELRAAVKFQIKVLDGVAVN